MSNYSAHLDQLNAQPLLRQGEHGRAAMDGLSSLYAWLPYGTLPEQMDRLVVASHSTKKKDQMAADAWAALVRGHGLDFYADAGQRGSQWQYAVIDAWETWLLLRESQDSATVDAWPWSWGNAQFEARGELDIEEIADVENMMFGGSDEVWKRTDMVDWRRGLARLSTQQACQDAASLVRAWPRADLPSIGMAIGALWAISVPGWVVGAKSLQIGGCRGKRRLLFTNWNT